jgi:hypothetical protein
MNPPRKKSKLDKSQETLDNLEITPGSIVIKNAPAEVPVPPEDIDISPDVLALIEATSSHPRKAIRGLKRELKREQAKPKLEEPDGE